MVTIELDDAEMVFMRNMLQNNVMGLLHIVVATAQTRLPLDQTAEMCMDSLERLDMLLGKFRQPLSGPPGTPRKHSQEDEQCDEC